MRLSALLALILFACIADAQENGLEVGGHTKFRLTGQSYPDDSIFRDLAGSNSQDVSGDLRLNLEWSGGRWSFDANYQLIAVHSDALEWASLLPPGAELFFSNLPTDDRRLFNLTDVISESGKNALLHRADRLWLAYSSEKAVVRFGRQALSWGNGLFYAPMDLVNPFDPSTIDTEYKSGDDMLYLQYLRDSGDDVQGAVVLRRDPLTGDVESDQATVSLKYHGFAGEYEYDLLAAQSYGDTVVGIGGGRSVGGAVWRGDVVVTDTDNDTYVQLVTNLTHSWIAFDRNMSGAIEYYFNGFGQKSGAYDPTSLATNPDLLLRLTRGELFTIGRHYLAGSVMIEMTPLWTLTPTLLGNVSDPSALLQLVTNYSLSDNMTLLGSINLPAGGNGTEFGGIDSGVPGRYLSGGPGIFAQFAWYF